MKCSLYGIPVKGTIRPDCRELNTLTDVEYPRIKDALAEARAQGDLSENALSKVKDEKGMKRLEKFLRLDVCPDCGGTRLSDAAI